MMRTHDAGDAARGARRHDRHPRRLGRPPPRPRRRGLPRPARRVRHRPGGRARVATPRTTCGPSTACSSPARSGCGPRATGTTRCPPATSRWPRAQVEVLSAPRRCRSRSTTTCTVGDEVRLRYRYLDLRRAGPAHALRTRSQVTSAIRRVMDEHGFLDIETPTLTRSTPEGARDFLVPVRLQPGPLVRAAAVAAAVQAAAHGRRLERYYQIARCFRDEDFRADRQPEFTQLDIEMCFLDEEDIYELGEEVMTPDLARRARRRADDAVPADDLRRGDAPLRRRPAGRAVRRRAGRPDGVLRRARRSGSSRPRTSARS